MSRSFQLAAKRCLDMLIACMALLLGLPALIAIALVIKLTSRGPVFYSQHRIGKNAAIFKLYKFRTMIPGAINQGRGISITPDDDRITKVGAFLRKTSLDELPQLFNVLKGDISLVGPRPTVPAHLQYYGEFEKKRLTVRPGLTGLAVIHGRANIPWSERIKWDIYYVENFSLRLDLKILCKTIPVVLKRQNAYYDYDKHGKPPFDLAKPQ